MTPVIAAAGSSGAKIAVATAKKAAVKQPSLKQLATAKTTERREQAPKVNPQIDAKLNAFIEKEKPLFEHYTKIVSDNPERAVRMLMLNKMQQAEYRERQQQTTFDRLKQWVDVRPDIAERIAAQIEKLPEDKRQGAFVNIAQRAVVQESTKQSTGPRV